MVDEGTFEISTSTVADNIAWYAGGINVAAFNNGAITLRETTISGNRAFDIAGGVRTFLSNDATVTLRNDTISGNSAKGSGGGLLLLASWGEMNRAFIDHCTLNANTSEQSGGGLFFGDPADVGAMKVSIRNSIIAGNLGTSGGPDIFSAVEGIGIAFSLVGDASSLGAGLTDSGGNLLNVDPQLGPLWDHGGATLTHLPATTSPVINGGDPTFSGTPAFDQRGSGFERVAGGRLDLGAVERQPREPVEIEQIVPSDGAATIHFGGDGSAGVTALCTPADGSSPLLATGTNSPIQVSGLINGATYTCTLQQDGSPDISAPAMVVPAAAPPTWGAAQPIPAWGVFAQLLTTLLLGCIGSGFRRRVAPG